MRTAFTFFLILFLSDLFASALFPVKDFGSNPGNLNMYLYQPENIKNKDKRSLIFVLHGCTQDANDVSELTGWNKLADLYGFYIVYPEQRITNNPTRCFNWFRSEDNCGKDGEAFSIYSMYQYMKSNYSINPDSVFITGLSAGAAMSVAMMAIHPEAFNSGAIFAGAPFGIASNMLMVSSAVAGLVSKTGEEWKELVEEQNPGYSGKYPRIIIFQGKDDYIVNKNCARELILQWSALWNSDTIPEEIENSFGGNKEVTRRSYYDKNGVIFMTYYEGKNTGHELYINPGACRNMGGKKGIYGKDQDLHSTWYAAMEMGLIPDQKIKIKADNDQKTYYLSVPHYEKSDYFWRIPGNWKIISTDTTNVIQVHPGPFPANFIVVEKDSLGCFYEYTGEIIERR